MVVMTSTAYCVDQPTQFKELEGYSIEGHSSH